MGGVYVSSEQIYEKVLGVEGGMARVEALLERHVALEEQRSAGVEMRLENHGTRLGGAEGRITQAESDVRALRTDLDTLQKEKTKAESRKAPWWVIPATIGTIIAGTSGLLTLIPALARLTPVP